MRRRQDSQMPQNHWPLPRQPTPRLVLFLPLANPSDVPVQLPNVSAQLHSVRLVPFNIARMPYERRVFTL
jgi:hypothetical protein